MTKKMDCKGFGPLLVIVGILFLLQDLNVWNFWGLSWYSLTLIIVGLKFVHMTYKK